MVSVPAFTLVILASLVFERYVFSVVPASGNQTTLADFYWRGKKLSIQHDLAAAKTLWI